MIMTKLEELVDWLEKQVKDPWGVVPALVAYGNCLAKARQLLAEEKAEEQRATADEGLWEELNALCERYSKREDDKSWTSMVKSILSRYRPIPVVKEQGGAGYHDVEKFFKDEAPKVVKEQGEAGLREALEKWIDTPSKNHPAYVGLVNTAFVDGQSFAADEVARILNDTPAPVASGLVEELRELCRAISGSHNTGSIRTATIIAIEQIISRYSKEAK